MQCGSHGNKAWPGLGRKQARLPSKRRSVTLTWFSITRPLPAYHCCHTWRGESCEWRTGINRLRRCLRLRSLQCRAWGTGLGARIYVRSDRREDKWKQWRAFRTWRKDFSEVAIAIVVSKSIIPRANKDLLGSTGKYTRYFVIHSKGKEFEKEDRYCCCSVIKPCLTPLQPCGL